MRPRGTALLLRAVKSPRSCPWLGEQGIAAQREQLSAGLRLNATQARPDAQHRCDGLPAIFAATHTPHLNQSSNPTTRILQSRHTPEQPLQANDTALQQGCLRPGAYLAALGFTASSPTEGSTWGPVAAAVDVIDALHTATGLPWWATFAGTALGEGTRMARKAQPVHVSVLVDVRLALTPFSADRVVCFAGCRVRAVTSLQAHKPCTYRAMTLNLSGHRQRAASTCMSLPPCAGVRAALLPVSLLQLRSSASAVPLFRKVGTCRLRLSLTLLPVYSSLHG